MEVNDKGVFIMKAKINGVRINYQLSGKTDGPVVALSHSLGSSLAMWEPQMASLEPHFRVLRYDTRGHGASDAPEGAYSLDELGEDAVGLLDALGIGLAHWVGLSMGGMIGQYLALRHPDLFISFSLCDTAAIIPEEAQPVWEERIHRARSGGMGTLVEETLERWFTSSYLKRKPPQVESIRTQFLATPVEGYIGCSEAIRKLNYLDQLSQIKTPTLIVVGEEDPGTPVSAAQAMHSRIAQSKLVVLPSAAHLSNVEQTEPFNKFLTDFLRSH
jgi:3-oxoadipate enol-lactonase